MAKKKLVAAFVLTRENLSLNIFLPWTLSLKDLYILILKPVWSVLCQTELHLTA